MGSTASWKRPSSASAVPTLNQGRAFAGDFETESVHRARSLLQTRFLARVAPARSREIATVPPITQGANRPGLHRRTRSVPAVARATKNPTEGR